MPQSGRRGSVVWDYFHKATKANNKGPWAICKKCNHGMQGIVSRMQKHLESCNRTVTTTSTDPDVIEIPSTPSTTLAPSNAKQQRIDSFVGNTSAQERDQLEVVYIIAFENTSSEGTLFLHQNITVFNHSPVYLHRKIFINI